MNVRIIAIGGFILLGACTSEQMALWIPQGDKTPMTTSAKLKACALDEARILVQNGSVWSLGMSAAAESVASTCIKKLALQSAGVDTQAASEAYNALKSLTDTAKAAVGSKQQN